MNHIVIVACVALLAGAGGAWLLTEVQGTGGSASTAEGMDDTALLQERIADLERELALLKNPPATLGADAPARARGTRGGDEAAVVEAVLAKLEDRVDARVTSKFEELAAKEADEGEGKGSRRGSRRKRMSLADAARELELTGGEEDELRRIYEDSMNRFLKLAAGPEGNVEDVKRDLEEAKKNPMAGRGLLMKYVPNMMKNLGEVMAITTDRETAVVKAIGPEKAKKLNEGYDVIEANPLGQGFQIGATMTSSDGSGR